MPQPAPGPGIYENVSFEEYLLWPYISNSRLAIAEKSMAHFRLGKAVKETESMRLGTLIHAGKLEPLALMERYVMQPDFAAKVRKPDGGVYTNPKGSTAYKAEVAEFAEKHPGKTILESSAYEKMMGVVTAISRNDRARLYLDSPGPVEVCVVWDDPETGIRCKGRVDKLVPGDRRFTDLKTSYDPSGFEWTLKERSYHRQAALYADGLASVTGVQDWQACIVVAETAPPFNVRAAPLSQRALLVGRMSYRILLKQIAGCLRSGDWPGVPDPEEWDLPGSSIEESMTVASTGEVTKF